MVKQSKEVVVVGSIGAPYGVKGWLKINSYTQPKKNIFSYKHWLLQFSQRWQAIEVHDHFIRQNMLAIKIEACSTREQAKNYTHAKIGVYRAYFPKLEENEYYWSDLEGLTVVNQQGIILGNVKYLFETGSNDVMVVQGNKEYFIPYIPGTYVLAVKLSKNQIEVNWDPDF